MLREMEEGKIKVEDFGEKVAYRATGYLLLNFIFISINFLFFCTRVVVARTQESSSNRHLRAGTGEAALGKAITGVLMCILFLCICKFERVRHLQIAPTTNSVPGLGLYEGRKWFKKFMKSP